MKVFLFLLCASFVLHAQQSLLPVQSKIALCSACHGEKGASSNPTWPNIAGQHGQYLRKQLGDFKLNQQRHSPLMTPLMRNLTEDDLDELAAYYAKMPTTERSHTQRNEELGLKLYKFGDFTKSIPACIACHGPKGTGNAQAGFPSLAGQHAAYTVLQLQAFKERKRTNDLNHIMQDISQKMTLHDMEAVANYIENLD